MNTYRVVITEHAKNQLREYLAYILRKFKNKQAAQAIRDDAKETKDILSRVASSNKLLENSKLKGYRKIHFQRHSYVMLYRIIDDTAYVDFIFHELQDYENKIK